VPRLTGGYLVNVPVWVWWLTLGTVAGFLVVDIFYIGRNPHEPSIGESARHLAFYIAAAVAFGIAVSSLAGGQHGLAYFAGWLTEYSLSVDNLFVFLLIMGRFGVPRQLQQTALLVGIVLALVMRGLFIALGAVAIARFSWVFYLFGAFLVYTAVKIGKNGSAEPGGLRENTLLRWVRRSVPSTDIFHGNRLLVVVDGQRLITPMFVVIIALGTTDLLFAMDSIPAIYGLTQEPYLVLSANLFALMGLRQLYFLLGGLLQRLIYLNIGLAILLGFIGFKLIFHALHENQVPFVNDGRSVGWAPDIPVAVSLGVIVGVLGITAIASLLRARAIENSP
jgi:tellurite resistance protein TerC